MINVNNVIEAVKDSYGRYRTLSGIYPLLDGDDVRLHSGAGFCLFEMEYRKRAVLMRCFLHRDNEQRTHLGEISSFLSAVDEPVYSGFSFHSEELMVFDDRGGHVYLDVAIEDKVSGKNIAVYAAEYLVGESQGIGSIRSLLGILADFARRHYSHRILTGNGIFSNLRVSDKGLLRLYGFAGSSRTDCSPDVTCIALVFCLLFLSCSDKRILNFIPEKDMFTGEWHRLLEKCKDMQVPDEVRALCAVLTRLADDSHRSTQHGATLLDLMAKAASGEIVCDKAISAVIDGFGIEPVANKETLAVVETHKYEFVGRMQGMLMRAFDGRRWCYLDKDARVAIPGPFMNAEDFWEGIAVVEVPEGVGVIGRDGNYIVPPVYDDVDIDETGNRLIVTSEGKSGILKFNGEQVIPLLYDGIFSGHEGIYVVEKDCKFGFITRDGKPVTDLIYDEAVCFSQGIARAKRQGREYIISPDGKEIDEIIN